LSQQHLQRSERAVLGRTEVGRIELSIDDASPNHASTTTSHRLQQQRVAVE